MVQLSATDSWKPETSVNPGKKKVSNSHQISSFHPKRISLALSTGIDSNLMLSLIRDEYPKLDVKCISVSFDETSEGNHAKIVPTTYSRLSTKSNSPFSGKSSKIFTTTSYFRQIVTGRFQPVYCSIYSRDLDGESLTIPLCI